MYRIRKLQVNLSGRTVLEIPDLQLPSHGLLSIIGPNGAGKSTLVRILAGLYSQYLGEVSIDAEEIAKLCPRKVARLVSFVPQELDSSCRYCVREILMMGRYPHQSRYLGGDCGANAVMARTVNNYGLGEFLERRVSDLSAGERQKVFIASSVIQETPCIILDEPTSALDFRESENLFRLLLMEVERERKLVICVTHDLNGALFNSDRILALKHGDVKFFGSPEDCSQQKLIQDIFGISPLVLPHPHKQVLMVIPGGGR